MCHFIFNLQYFKTNLIFSQQIGGDEQITSSTSTIQTNQIQKRKSQQSQENANKRQKIDLTTENNEVCETVKLFFASVFCY